MSDNIAFGIGCLHFGVKGVPPFVITGQEYIDSLMNTLEKVSNIDNISIEADDTFKTISLEIMEDLDDIEEGTNFFPIPSCRLKIQFDLYIPIRIQKELWPVQSPPQPHLREV